MEFRIPFTTSPRRLAGIATALFALAVFATQASAATEAPYGGTAAAIPGTVQAENYDTGGQGVAYNVTSTNGTANSYRSDGVDIEATTDTGGGYDLGWTAAGQWFRYTVNVATAGTYTVSLRVAADATVTNGLHISNSSGTNLSGEVSMPSTGGWQTWETVTASVTLPVGQQTLTVNQDTGGYNINYMAFASTGGVGGTIANGTYTLAPECATGSRLDDSGASTATGNPIVIYTSNGTTAQSWATSSTGVTPAGDYNLAAIGAYCLDATNTTSGSAVELYPCVGTAAQAWSIAADTSPAGYYELHPSGNTGLCLDVAAAGTANGTVVDVYTCNSTNAQQWSGFTASSGSAPSAPSLSATAGNAQVSLAWTASSGATSYNVYRGASSGGEGGTPIATGITGTSFTNTGLTNGTTYYYKLAAVNSYGTSGQSGEASATPTSGMTAEGPYGGTPWAIPGTVYADNYDTGGQSVAYNVTSTNGSANTERSQGVDLEACTDTTTNGYDLGWTAASQWFRYTVNVATAGTYTVSLRVAADAAVTNGLHISNASGTNLSGEVSMPSTGGWQTWETVNTSVTLPAGQQVLTVNQDTGGYNINYITFASGAGSGSGTTTGTISFHLLLGTGGTPGDSMTLTGGNYNDLIMSNMIAGVMYGHLVKEYYPGIQFSNDYLYGSVMAQLLQENIETELYESGSTLIDPSSNQQAVMGEGQGGPYQINNYAIDMVGGTYTPAGHSLINFIALQNNIGYTIATAPTQYTKDTPASFNNKYYGPMLPAFFHYIDFVALNVIGTGANPYSTPWQPEYDEALANFVNLPNSFLDMLLNAAYNQGYYGGLVASYSTEGATATEATVASVDSYSSVWGNTSTYVQYPYQVHYYLDQMYDNPIPTTSPTTTTTPANHIEFSMSTLEGVYTNVFETLDYSNGTNAAQYFTAAQAQSAFSSALSSNGVSSSATLDLSNSSNRAQIFSVINSAIGNLESAVGMKFNTTTLSQL